MTQAFKWNWTRLFMPLAPLWCRLFFLADAARSLMLLNTKFSSLRSLMLARSTHLTPPRGAADDDRIWCLDHPIWPLQGNNNNNNNNNNMSKQWNSDTMTNSTIFHVQVTIWTWAALRNTAPGSCSSQCRSCSLSDWGCGELWRRL